MKKLFYFIYFIGTLILVSFRGGEIAYLLFYFALLLPLLSLIYSVYVYFRFRIVQEVSRTVVKGSEVPYRLIMANEDFIPLLNIHMNFFDEMTSMKDSTGRVCLLPGQHVRIDTKMYCKYRGTYPVGVKSVSVTDFLGLFTITYPMKSQIRLTARPRILPLEKLNAILQTQDSKSHLFSLASYEDLLSHDLKQYMPGDQLKHIHWKNSARAGELLVRKQMPEEFFEIIVMIDLHPVSGSNSVRLQTEDNIMEAAVAFVHEYYFKKIPVRIVYMEQRLQEIAVDLHTGFDTFYDKCANIAFKAQKPIEVVFSEYISHVYASNIVIITAFTTETLLRLADDSRKLGNHIVLVQTGELPL